MAATLVSKTALINTNMTAFRESIDSATGQLYATPFSTTDEARKAVLKAVLATTYNSRRQKTQGG